MKLSRILLTLLGVALVTHFCHAKHDIVIYGGTASGVAAAVQAKRMGKSVIIIEPGQHIGGLTSGGLGYTDSGNKAVIGGISREFYQRVRKHYENDKSWTFGAKNVRKDDDAMWVFEPKVAEAILREMLKENQIDVVFGERLNRKEKSSVKVEDKSITQISMVSGKTFPGKVFIDATYEGDLMAMAGVSYHVGREANATYGETLNGVATKWQKHKHMFSKKVSPYIISGDSKSGLLPTIEEKIPEDGSADQRIQAYCFRMCMCLDPNNRVLFAKPEGYRESEYELLLRNFEAGDVMLPLKLDMMPNGKTDTNNNGAVSTDYIGQNYAYPEASDDDRSAIIKRHERYQKGLMWTLQSHPRVPQKIRDTMAKWGLAKDEFTDNGNWPHQIYVREARRMIGQYVHTEADCRRTRQTPVSVGMGSYNMDSHNCTRYVTAQGFVQNEGDVQESPRGAYPISYGSIIPKAEQCKNLLVPVCVSSSHIAYGSIRMEPVFMVLGQSAATAACMAIDAKCEVQAIDTAKLQERLIKDKQVLTMPAKAIGPNAIDPKTLKGIVVDDEAAKLVGFDTVSSASTGYVGNGYRHDGNTKKGEQTATFKTTIEKDGNYEVRFYYTPNANRDKAVPVSINDGKTIDFKVDQTKANQGGFVVLGSYQYPKGRDVTVTISNEKTTGYVVVDAIQWVAK